MFCPNCGKRIPDGSRFCGECGKPIAAAPAPATQAKPSPQPIQPQPAQQPIQQPVQPPVQPPIQQPVQHPAQQPVQQPSVFTRRASAAAGEIALAQTGVNLTGELPAPLKVIADSFRSFTASLKAAGKDPKKLIPALVLAVVWLALGILRALDVNPLPVRAMSFLTFASAGLNGGIAGAVGGILGKGVFAAAVTTLIRSLTTKNSGQKRSLGDTVKGALGVSPDTLWSWLGGIGAAIVLYTFLAGGGIGRYSFMGGLAAAYLTAKAALSGGFLSRLVSSISYKIRGKATGGAAGFLRGLTVGFSAGALLGLLNIPWILFILGALLLVGGAVMMILQATGVVKLGKGDKA